MANRARDVVAKDAEEKERAGAMATMVTNEGRLLQGGRIAGQRGSLKRWVFQYMFAYMETHTQCADV